MSPTYKNLFWSLLPMLLAGISPEFCWGVSNTITLHVKVESAPCKINNDEIISINFGDNLLTTLIDGNEYKKIINYSLDCSQGANDALKLKISGLASEFDHTVLQTSQQNLGIALLNNTEPFPLNQWINFNNNHPPELIAVPVKSPGSQLKAGAFTAVATMTIDYQ